MNRIMFSLTPSSKPWQTWHVELQKEINEQLARNVGKLEISSRREYCNLHMIEWEEGITKLPDDDLPIFFYMEQLDAFSDLIDLVRDRKHRVYVLTESTEVYQAAESFGLNAHYWAKPPRVPKHKYFNVRENHKEREPSFTLISNVSRNEDNVPEIIKTYFAMCLYETEDGEMLSNHDLNIFSAYELPVEPFNTVYFHGLQPNPIMFKTLEKSRLFISPYAGKSVSTNILDAIFIGVPVLIKDTQTNRESFDLSDDSYYFETKDLAKKIKKFKEMDEPSIKDIADRNLRTVLSVDDYHIENSIERLFEIFKGVIKR